MSDLHKLSYWEAIYKDEKNNYEESNIPLEEWFEENCAEIIDWIEKEFKNKKDVPILDIGCGNGLFLYKLHEKGFVNLYGMDYSSTAINLAKTFFNGINIYVEVLDIYHLETKIEKSKLNKKYGLLNDKGTFDIFFMNNEAQEYFKHISHLLHNNTIFIITSCNACKEELLHIIQQFNQTNEKWNLSLIDEILYETISFGGKVGQLVTTLVFKCT